MTKCHPVLPILPLLFVLPAALPLASHGAEPLIVVEDRGGASALPYYEALNLQPRESNRHGAARLPLPTPQVPATPADEAAMLPVRSAKLTPGTVARRVIEAPGLRPFAVVGDDEVSRAWLRRHAASLRERGAVGLVVNVETAQALARLRALAPGVPLAPVAGDDLAERLSLRHYPALVTATGIEQ
ncbi:integrating conjugative element protein [Stenotrophomonas sp. NLF4-10]|uniref:integrating conjugative element protein n=1 Tax=Stenotrophomonas sp. NLF4-10 TaxID=2918754 RepID=UPI001EFA5ABD|nr:integrating conjugative element protein [Stenotrophomonas sp. NLF4-10]MCG8277441.1 integrating conjugative element protein [Stenotrophomonas sp. NLF4-10]